MATCVHFLNVPDHELPCERITLASLREYVGRTGATLNLITQRKFLDYPVQYEAMQVFEAGAAYDWNIYIGAGVVLGAQLADPTSYMRPDCVGTYMTYSAANQFNTAGNVYFERDERGVGIAEGIVLTHNLTHELWEPLPGTYAQYAPLIRDGSPQKITSYALAHNLAKYGLKLCGLFPSNAQFDVITEEKLAGGSVEHYLSRLSQKWRSGSY